MVIVGGAAAAVATGGGAGACAPNPRWGRTGASDDAAWANAHEATMLFNSCMDGSGCGLYSKLERSVSETKQGGKYNRM